MNDVTIHVDGVPCRVAGDCTVAAALLARGIEAFRRDLRGNPRAPVCGMGSCGECRVTIDGRPDQRSCLMPVRDGMTVETAT